MQTRAPKVCHVSRFAPALVVQRGLFQSSARPEACCDQGCESEQYRTIGLRQGNRDACDRSEAVASSGHVHVRSVWLGNVPAGQWTDIVSVRCRVIFL